jgi:hypothetical protein
VRYLGEINDSQRAAWCQTIEAFDERGQAGRQVALFPEDRATPLLGLARNQPLRLSDWTA